MTSPAQKQQPQAASGYRGSCHNILLVLLCNLLLFLVENFSFYCLLCCCQHRPGSALASLVTLSETSHGLTASHSLRQQGLNVSSSSCQLSTRICILDKGLVFSHRAMAPVADITRLSGMTRLPERKRLPERTCLLESTHLSEEHTFQQEHAFWKEHAFLKEPVFLKEHTFQQEQAF